MDRPVTETTQNRIWTIPNLLTLLRILLVPVFCWTYLGLHNMWLTVGMLALSGLTDVADGWIARRFDMISDVGKVLDPIADKLTQAAMLLCLMLTFPTLLPVFVLLVVKELTDGILGLLVIRRCGVVLAAEWHGKLTTVLLYVTLGLHVLWLSVPAWGEMPAWLSLTLVILCSVMTILSLVFYTVRNLRALRSSNMADQTEESAKEHTEQ